MGEITRVYTKFPVTPNSIDAPIASQASRSAERRRAAVKHTAAAPR
jgi:hypothetical protein